MISFSEGKWKGSNSIANGSLVFEEAPILLCPSDVPVGWRKLAKKISKLEPDRKPVGAPETMPSWEQVTLNEAIARLVYAFDQLDSSSKSSIMEMYTDIDQSCDSPFQSLIKKAKQMITKEGSKLGLSKATVASLHELLTILTTKVCVTLDGGAVLFRKLGTVPHSCTPNCMFIPRSGNIGHLVAIRDIDAGEDITCSHIPTNCLRANVETRQAWLRGIAGSMCRSDCCNAGYDLRRRVICPRCHPTESRGLLTGSDQSDLCFAAKSNTSSLWKGLKCGAEMEETEAIDLTKESALVRKILILNEADMDIARLSQYTRTAIQEALRVFGKGHFCYQQLLLLNCGLALHALCSSGANVTKQQRVMFVSWVKMLVDVVNFSLQTELPFSGMDELVRIIIAPETLQMAQKVMNATKKDELETVEYLSIFSRFAEQSCDCLVLIEGPESVHSQDALKLRNWWVKKYKSWINTPDEVVVEKASDASFVSTQVTDTSTLETPKGSMTAASKTSWIRQYAVPIAVGSALVGVTAAIIYKRSRK